MNRSMNSAGKLTLAVCAVLAVLFFGFCGDKKSSRKALSRRQAVLSSAQHILFLLIEHCEDNRVEVPKFDSRHLPDWWHDQDRLTGLDSSLYVISSPNAEGLTLSSISQNKPLLLFRGSAANAVLGTPWISINKHGELIPEPESKLVLR
jgi:hypothetical protein